MTERRGGIWKAAEGGGTLVRDHDMIEAIGGLPLANRTPIERVALDLADELRYLYRVIYRGYRFGSFDFSILKRNAEGLFGQKEIGRPVQERPSLEGLGETTESRTNDSTGGEG